MSDGVMAVPGVWNCAEVAECPEKLCSSQQYSQTQAFSKTTKRHIKINFLPILPDLVYLYVEYEVLYF